MVRGAFIGLGVGVGLAIVAVVGGFLASGARATVPCPTGWTGAERSSLAAGGRVLRTCVAPSGPSGGTMQLLWTAGGALSTEQTEAIARAGGFAGTVRFGAEEALEGEVRGAALSREDRGGLLRSDVYFLSAGQRYGLVSIVFGREATFVQDDRVAAWFDTIEGVAPWGAPVRPTLRARCPEGFSEAPARPADAVALCLSGVGTEAFTVLRLSQREGGFGSEEDRVRMAGDLAQRISGNRENPARMLEAPAPFTRARNVDAIRARFESDERVVLPRGALWARTAGSGNVLAVYVGRDDTDAYGAVYGALRAVKARRVAMGTVAGGAAFVALLGALAGALGGRLRRQDADMPASG